MNRYTGLQQKVDETARKIYSLVGNEVPSLFDTAKWRGKLMEWAMRDDSVKVPLFRFIDALPSVKDDSRVIELLNEYFENVDNSPFVIKRGLKSLAGIGILPGVAGRIIRSRVASFGRQFIAGRDPVDSEVALQRLRREGLAFSVDLLGEAVLSHREATVFQQRYLDLLDLLGPKVRAWRERPQLDRDDAGPIPRLDISVKPSSFYCHLDPVHWEKSLEMVRKSLSPVLAKAVEVGSSVTLDMEHYYLKELTIQIFKSLLDQHPDCRFAAIAIQAYLADTQADVLALIDWAKSQKKRIGIRLVKGAYWDYETVINRQRGWPVPVLLQKDETDRAFDRLARILLENVDCVRPAFATHNIRSISHAVAAAESLALPKSAFEIQVIYGMAEPVRAALKKLGFRVRVYTPVGELIPGMAYLIRRLLENTSNESFLRQTFYEQPSSPSPGQSLQEEPSSAVSKTEFRNEPLRDFSKAENRRRMREALAAVRKGFGTRYQLIIGSRDVWTDNEILSKNPAAPAEVVGRVCSAAREQAEAAVKEARQAWTRWSQTPPEDRADYLFRVADSMRARRFELTAMEVYEVGKVWKESDADVAEAIDYLEYYAREMIRLGSPARLGKYPGEKNLYIYEPRGVGSVISPWNFPMAIPMGMVSAGLVTGNCIIFKPSGLSPVLGWNIVQLFRDAGLPSGVLQLVAGPGEAVGEYLVSHPGIDFVAFTGSKDVGLQILERAAKPHPGQRSIKRVIAELGGKNAIIVDETADLDEAVKGVLESALGYQGQKCSACSRVIVFKDAFEEFCSRLEAAMDSVPMGPPEHPENLMGPVVDEQGLKKVLRYVSLSRQEGTILFQGHTDLGGQYVPPLMVSDLRPDSPVLHEEIFGPVLAVARVDNLDEAIRMANSTAQALTGGIFSRSPANIEKAQRELRAGNLYINRKITGALVGRQPFGGVGMSGVGHKAGGPDYLQQFMNGKSVSENTLRRGFAPDE